MPASSPAWPSELPTAVSGPVIVEYIPAAVPADQDMPSFPILLASAQLPNQPPLAPLPPGTEEGVPAFFVQLQPPGPQRLFRLESEAAFRERVRQEAPRQPYQPVIFPPEPVIASGVYERHWPGRAEWTEPNYVCHCPLFYEQKNFERYGWDLGIITPVISGLTFYCDLLLSPYHALVHPEGCYECSAGYCLPGDPVPLLLYPPRWPISIESDPCLRGSATVVH
jgi:hypothetical protein